MWLNKILKKSWSYQNIFPYQSNKVITTLMQRRTELDKRVPFKDITEQKVKFVVIIAYYWKLYVNSVVVVFSSSRIQYFSSNLAGICWLLKLEHCIDMLVVG